jgi:hypothetical protein
MQRAVDRELNCWYVAGIPSNHDTQPHEPVIPGLSLQVAMGIPA